MQNVVFSGINYRELEPVFLLDYKNDDKICRQELGTKDRSGTISVVSDDAFCTGFYKLDELLAYPCRTATIPLSGGNKSWHQCFECKRLTAFDPVFYRTTEMSEAQKRYNACPHNVYIAYFGDGYKKVGIANHGRIQERLLEQGSIFAIIIAKCENAYKAREIESQIVNTRKVRETMNQNLKTKLIKDNLSKSSVNDIRKIAFEELFAIYDEVSGIVADYGEIMQEKFDPWNVYGELSNLASIYDADQVSGKIVSVIGSSIVFENNGDYYINNIKNIVGKKISLGKNIDVIDKKTSIIQSSLF